MASASMERPEGTKAPASLRVDAIGPVSTGSVTWRMDGQWCATIAVKVTLALVPDGAMVLARQRPILDDEQTFLHNPVSSVQRPSDLALFVPRTDVVLTGHAHIPGGGTATHTVVRLAVHRERALLDKALIVTGDRVKGALPERFQRLPLVYERSFGGPGCADNPVGVGSVGTTAPNIELPGKPGVPAGFGPIGRAWAARRKLADGVVRKALRERPAEVPAGFDWRFFQAAPPDQQLDGLTGDEWILLDGMHPDHARLQSCLPGLRAEIFLYGAEILESTPVGPTAFRADLVTIEPDAGLCTVTFRAVVCVATADDLHDLRVAAGVATNEEPVPWPAHEELVARWNHEDEPPTQRLTTPVAPKVPFDRTLTIASAPAPQPASPPLPPSIRAPSTRATVEPVRDITDTLDLESKADFTADLPFAGVGPGVSSEAEKTIPGAPFPGVSGASRRRKKRGTKLPPRVAPVPPPRRTGQVPFVFREPFAGATVAWEHRPPQPSLAVVVKGTFAIVPGERAQLLDESEPPQGDVHAGEAFASSVLYPSDLALFKPQADVLLVGHAFPQARHGSTAHVRFRFGKREGATFDRRAAVVGDRRLQNGVASEPERFEKMPLVFERAFGGPDTPANPAGRGRTALPDGSIPLPNLEDPDRLVRNVNDRPPPVAFCGVPMRWPGRWSKLGTYDEKSAEECWPYFAKDFEWSFFQAAPPEQRLPHLQGDEPFSLAGVHRQHPVLEGELPHLAVRCFAVPAEGSSKGFHEVLLRLDTVVLAPDTMRLHLVWRGVLDVLNDDAPELKALFVMAQPSRDRAPTLTEARAAYEETLRLEKEQRLGKKRAPAAVVPEPEAPSAQAAPPPPDDTDAKIAAHTAKLKEKLATLGLALPPLDGAAEAPLSPPMPLRDPETTFAKMRAAGMKEEDLGELRKALDDAQGPDHPPETQGSPEGLAEEASGRLTRARVVTMLAEDQDAGLDGLDLSGLDLSELDFSKRSLRKARMKETSFAGANLAGAALAGAVLVRADLREADLSDADLAGADLYGADLRDSDLSRAALDGADLSAVHADRARFRGVRGERVRLCGASLAGASFDGAELPSADLSGATLVDASFEGASLPEVRLYDADGARTSFRRARLERARAEGASMTDAGLAGALAEGSIWNDATLTSASFRGAVLKGATFLRASCSGVVLAAADLTGARLGKAKLTRASFSKAKLTGASLEGADLGGADLRNACLHRAEGWKANTRGADTTGAIVTHTTLGRRA